MNHRVCIKSAAFMCLNVGDTGQDPLSHCTSVLFIQFNWDLDPDPFLPAVQPSCPVFFTVVTSPCTFNASCFWFISSNCPPLPLFWQTLAPVPPLLDITRLCCMVLHSEWPVGICLKDPNTLHCVHISASLSPPLNPHFYSAITLKAKQPLALTQTLDCISFHPN